MKKIVLLLVLIPQYILAQNTKQDSMDFDTVSIISPVENKPEFVGGEKMLLRFIKENLNYPKTQDCVEGIVFVGFTIEDDGRITDIKIRRKLHPLFDEEAIRVVRLMPKWKPMYSDYEKKYIKCGYTLPIKFKLK